MDAISELPKSWQRELADCVGESFVASDESEREWAGWDATGSYRLGSLATRTARPLAVVRPGNTDEVAAVVRWAARRGVPLVPRGGGTGVMGGAIPLRPAIVLDLTRLDQIRVEPENMLVEAGAGAYLSAVNEALRPHGLMLAHDPWSVSIATVGGAIGTDGVGYMAGRRGSMAEQVAALEAVLPDGEVVRTPLYKPVVGPDLRSLWVGSQGTFGIVTRAWLLCVPLPEAQYFQSFRFRGFEQGYRAILDLWRAGLSYDLLDFGDGPPEFFDLPAGHEDEQGRTAVLHLGAFGNREEAEARIRAARRICRAVGGTDLGAEPAQRYWAQRHHLGQRYAREVIRPRDIQARRRFGQAGLDYINLAVPPKQLLAYRRAALQRVATEPGFVVGETGIWCRPELFSLVIVETPSSAPADGKPARVDLAPAGRDPARMQLLMTDLLRMAIAHGGTIEFIHGPGLKLLPLLGEQLGNGLEVIRRLKGALDPAEILNPGKWSPFPPPTGP